MKLYGIKMHNFMRFGESDNSIVFNVTKEQKKEINEGKLTLDQLYFSISEDPVRYVEKVNKLDDNVLEGIVGITGMTGGDFDSSNGSGKSTIFEAIAYLFYDRVVRQTANNNKKGQAGFSVVTKLAGKYPDTLRESYVEAYFEEDERLYRLKRGKSFSKNQKTSSNIFEFDEIGDEFEDGTDSLSSHRKADTKKSLDQVIVEDYDIFVNTVMFGQADAGKFLTGTDKIKKDMIIELLKLEDIVHGCIDVIRSKKKVENDKLNNFISRADSLKELVVKAHNEFDEDDLEYSDELLDAVSTYVDNRLEYKKEEKKKVEEKLATTDQNIQDLENSEVVKKMKALVLEGKALVAERNKITEKKDASIKDWKKVLDDTEKELQRAMTTIADKEHAIKLKKEEKNKLDKEVSSFLESRHKKIIESAKEAISKKDHYEERLALCNKKKEEVLKKLSEFDTIIDLRMKDVAKLERQVNDAGSDQYVCQECHNLVSKEHTLKKIEAIKEVVDQNTEIRQKVIVRFNKIEEAICTLKQYLIDVDQSRVELQNSTTALLNHNSNREKLAGIDELIAQLEDALKNAQLNRKKCDLAIKEYKLKCETLEMTCLTECNVINEQIQDKRAELTTLKEESGAIQERMKTLRSDKEIYLRSIQTIDTECGSLSQKRDNVIELGKQIKEENENIEVTKKQLQRLKILESAFGLEGVQTRIVSKYLPLLNMYVKEFLDTLSNGRLSVNLIINDKSKVDMEIIGGTADNYVMLSGGEKMVVRLAVDVGLSLLSFSRTSKTPDMICLDEIFGPLDPEHTKSVFKMLEDLKGRFKKVFLISHKSEIQSLVENNIVIEKSSGNRGLSKIVGIRDITV